MRTSIPTALCFLMVFSTSHRLVAEDAMKNENTADSDLKLEVGDVQRTAESVTKAPLKKVRARSRQIDKAIARDLEKHKIARNARTSDEVFLRRVYLDVIGRIPTYTEAQEFLESDKKDKRSVLIDELLDSEGYVSHHFNYFADLLRIQSRLRYAPASYYIDFVKNSLVAKQ